MRFRRGAAVMAGVAVAGVAFFLSLHTQLATPVSSRMMLDRHGDYLGEVPGDDDALGYWPLPYELPTRMELATLHTEDRHFHEHAGVHLPSVLRALWQNVSNLRVISGASTVAMQVARMQTPGGRNILRKVKEAAEAWLLVHEHGHQKVLRHYLTLAPYGNRVHGAVRAARLYFDKPLEDLSWLQAAFLAGLPQSPGRLNPFQFDGRERAMKRAHRILAALHEHGVISDEELATARRSHLGLVAPPRRPLEALHAVLALSTLAQSRTEPILHTTLDLEIQKRVMRTVKENLAANRALGASNSSALVVDPAIGDVLAYVGSTNYFNLRDHGAVDYVKTRRSPGSALKPFIYALAMETRGWTAATALADTPVEFQAESGVAYLPQNISHNYLGPMLLRNALGNSRNIPALRALSEIGVERVLRFMAAAGVADISWEPEAYGLGLALGNLPVTVEEITGLYLMLANGGVMRPLRYFQEDAPQLGPRLLSRGTAQVISDVLADPSARRPTFPAGGPLDYDDMAVAVKTGTSQGNRDAWTVAFSDRLVVALWLGNHDWQRMNRVTGATGTAPAVHHIFNHIMPLREPHRSVLQRFPSPDGFGTVATCALTGLRAGPDCPSHHSEVFAPGTAPNLACQVHKRLLLDKRNNLRAGPHCPPRFTAQRVVVDLPPEYQRWARAQRLEVAPTLFSPLCPSPRLEQAPSVAIREPRNHVRFLHDPDTPQDFSSVRLSADVFPPEEDVVFLVDGEPVARVGYPHEIRLPLTPGRHLITAAMARLGQVSQPVTVTVEN